MATREKPYADRFQELLWPALEAAPGFTVAAAVRAIPFFGPEYKERLVPYVRKYRSEIDGLYEQNPYGVPITRGGWAGNETIIRWASTNYHVHKAFPEIVGREAVLDGLTYILGRHPASNLSFVSGVGTRSKRVAYGQNRPSSPSSPAAWCRASWCSSPTSPRTRRTGRSSGARTSTWSTSAPTGSSSPTRRTTSCATRIREPRGRARTPSTRGATMRPGHGTCGREPIPTPNGTGHQPLP